MDDKAFAALLKSVRDMGSHMRGKRVRGARVREVQELEPRALRTVSSVKARR